MAKRGARPSKLGLPVCDVCGLPIRPRSVASACEGVGPPPSAMGPGAAEFAEGGLARGVPEPLHSMIGHAEKWGEGLSEVQRAGRMAKDLADNPVAFAIKHGLDYLL